MILETTFLVDLERETKKRAGAAHRFLESHAETEFFLTATIAGELAAGKSMARRFDWDSVVSRFPVLPIDVEVAWEYGVLSLQLSAAGTMIGTNDLWIAATARANAMPVVTSNQREYRRVPGLEVLSYR